MTLKIQAYQRQGKKCKELVDEYEFCCWDKLIKWLDGFSPYKCKKCADKDTRTHKIE